MTRSPAFPSRCLYERHRLQKVTKSLNRQIFIVQNEPTLFAERCAFSRKNYKKKQPSFPHLTNMSEEQLTKLEKLEKRRQQLAKWKLKKASVDSVLESLVSTNNEENNVSNSETNPSNQGISENSPIPQSAEELKKIERQRKLEEWKRKKQQLSQNIPLSKAEAGIKNDVETFKTAKIPVQTRLDAWKKQKSGENAPILPLKTVSTISRKRSAPAARVNVFAEDDDEDLDSKPKFRAPTAKRSNYNRADESGTSKIPRIEGQDQIDELDAFLESLEPTGEEAEEKNGAETEENTESTVSIVGGSVPGLVDESEEGSEDEEDRLIQTKMKIFAKGKELNKVDHEMVEYVSFKKDFYIELPAVKALSTSEIKALRLEMDGIKVSGNHVPRPIWTWDQLGISPLVLNIMQEKLGYHKPTSIQSQALPAIMSGRDFMGVAKTGSGKTLAFVLPLIGHVQAQPPLAKGDGPIGILLTPTRELALQIYKQLCHFTKKLGISACCCYGGSSIEPQIAELKKGSQIVVATPGRLIDLLAANNGRICNLRRVTYIVLDEADRMFDFGFEPQVNKIFAQIRPDRQSILFSATFAKKMESLARAVLNDPVEVVVGGISVVAPEITQKVEFFQVEDGETHESVFERKFSKLLDVLATFPDVKKLVFVEKQDSADALLVKLLSHKVPCVAIHGAKEQIDRKYAIRDFSTKDSGIDVLIATSVAARGLDVKGLDLVVNFDPANHMEDYVHRVGRTGRAGNHGDAYTFVTSEQERPITDLVKALRLSKVSETEIDPRLVKICDTFLEKVKAGKEKFRFGFGGNGLNKLDETRSSTKLMERRAYDVETDPKTTQTMKLGKQASTNGSEKQIPELALDLPEFKVIEGRAEETSGPDRCKFHSRVTINDLPQKARWVVVNADNLAQIIEATSTSITNKGQYYAPKTKIPTTVKKAGRDVPAPPKLYLLIEGLTENAVNEANRMIRQKMIEGLEQAAADEGLSAPGKYTV